MMTSNKVIPARCATVGTVQFQGSLVAVQQHNGTKSEGCPLRRTVQGKDAGSSTKRGTYHDEQTSPGAEAQQ